jgi:hypothetical protein
MAPSLAALGSALPDLVLGLVFLLAWLTPDRFDEGMLGFLVMTMLLEFIIVHSSAIMGSVVVSEQPGREKATRLLGLGALYSLFAGGFSLSFKSWWPLATFWGLTLNRLLSVLLGQAPTGEARAFVQRGWAAGAVFYLLFAFVTVFLPIPRLGITPEVVRAAGLPGGGLWVDEPWRVAAFGFLYFTAVGVSELRGHRWAAGGALPEEPARAA